MNTMISNRLKKLEDETPSTDVAPYRRMSYSEKKDFIRQFYAKLIHADHTLSETEYEDLLLEQFPEVSLLETWPKEGEKKPIEDMTRNEKEASVMAFYFREAYKVAYMRGRRWQNENTYRA
jgi:hypothetical protein